MVAKVFEEMKWRKNYLTEVQEHVLGVLHEFRADAANNGNKIEIEDTAATVMGPTIEIKESGERKSSIYAEIYTTGDIEIMRECSVNGKSGKAIEERHLIDFSKETEATAVDLLLIMARDHLGFVGAKLENYLNNQISADQNQDLSQSWEP
ncbi:hypothetical protein [Lentilitoribacter sp. EG35]|uniref:hypothetical protein n=1 Tax=Lentilitoribacter sp. EG35 TaxID=3234192 RepID=UPI00346123DF